MRCKDKTKLNLYNHIHINNEWHTEHVTFREHGRCASLPNVMRFM